MIVIIVQKPVLDLELLRLLIDSKACDGKDEERHYLQLVMDQLREETMRDYARYDRAFPRAELVEEYLNWFQTKMNKPTN
jgi:hypothetical protein